MAFGILFLAGCEGPPIPQEVRQAELQELDLWRIGGPSYAPQEYQRYTSALRKAKDDLIRERSRLFFLRDYGEVQAEFQTLVKEGVDLRARIEAEKNSRALDIQTQAAA